MAWHHPCRLGETQKSITDVMRDITEWGDRMSTGTSDQIETYFGVSIRVFLMVARGMMERKLLDPFQNKWVNGEGWGRSNSERGG